jgi:hypothetical protein
MPNAAVFRRSGLAGFGQKPRAVARQTATLRCGEENSSAKIVINNFPFRLASEFQFSRFLILPASMAPPSSVFTAPPIQSPPRHPAAKIPRCPPTKSVPAFPAGINPDETISAARRRIRSPSVKVGECTRAEIPSPRARPFTNCVLPAPSSPDSAMTIRVPPRGQIFRRAIPFPPDYAK